jgi:hypothetical protein
VTYPQGEDFASRRREFGGFAEMVLHYLCEPAFNRPDTIRPHKDDFYALGDLDELHKIADRLYDPLMAAGDYEIVALRDHFEDHWPKFRAALPFHEPERRWLTDRLYANDTGDKIRYIAEDVADISRQEGTIVSAGVHRVVIGRTLLHQWLNWRREAGEYRDQGTLDIARDALHDLMTAVSPETDIPASYIHLGKSAPPTPEA